MHYVSKRTMSASTAAKPVALVKAARLDGHECCLNNEQHPCPSRRSQLRRAIGQKKISNVLFPDALVAPCEPSHCLVTVAA
jgi:hypothetical protein